MLQRCDSAVSHAAAAHALLEIKGMHAGEECASPAQTRERSSTVTAGLECDPTNSDEVITANTGRAGAWRLMLQ